MCKTLHFFGIVFQVCIRSFFLWLIVALLLWCAGFQLLYSFIFQGVSWLFFSISTFHIFRKPCLISLRRLSVVGMKSAACKYWASSGFEVCARILFTKFSDCCVPRGTSQIPVFFFWLLWLFLLRYSGLTFLICLSWWCIHHHITLLIILMGLSSFLVKCGYASLACLDLVAGVLLYVRTLLWFHMVVLTSYHFP